MKTITLLARISSQFHPCKGSDAVLVLDARGADEQFVMVERGYTSDSDLQALKDNFCFVKLVGGTQYYRIATVVQTDDFLLKAELISIEKNGSN